MDIKALGAWGPFLKNEFEKPYFKFLMEKVSVSYAEEDVVVYPPKEVLFQALNLTSPENTRCVILGQVIFSH